MKGTATSPSITPLFCVSSWVKNLSEVALASAETSHAMLASVGAVVKEAFVDCRVGGVIVAERGGVGVGPTKLWPVICGCSVPVSWPVSCRWIGLVAPGLDPVEAFGAERPPEAASYVPGGKEVGRTRLGFAIQLCIRYMPMIKSVRSKAPRSCVSVKFLLN